jgi:hypothetical protein
MMMSPLEIASNHSSQKRRTINDDMDADNNKVIPSDYEDDEFVDFVELKDPATIIPLLEQELVLPSDEVQNGKKPTLYQQIQQCTNVHKTAPKKKTDRVPAVKPNALKNKEWYKIENSLENFPNVGQSTRNPWDRVQGYV